MSATSGRLDLSRRGREMPHSAIDKLVPPAEAAAARGVRIHYLNIGQPDLATPPEMLAALRGFAGPTVAYAPSRGQPETLRAWSAYYRHACGAEIPPEHLLVTTGGGEAIVFALMAVADPGDDVLVFDPSYTSYCGFAAMAGVRLNAVVLDPADDYALPPAATIEAALTPRTRAILLCNPNNPTGAVYSEGNLRLLVEIAERHDLFLIVDEVYRELVFDGLPQTTILSLPEALERTILIDSISKRFNACGARVGCLYSGNAALRDAALRFAQARISSPAVEQLAAVPMLSDPLAYTAALAAEYERRRDGVLAALDELPGVTHSRPRGAFYLILGLPVADSETFARWLLESFELDGETVMLSPLQGFYITPGRGANEVRLAFVLDEERLARAVRILGAGLQQFATR